MAKNESSFDGSFDFEYKTFGVITVAKLCKSIFDPVSSSTCEKDATHLKKLKSTSIVSRFTFGRRQHVRCRIFFLAWLSASPKVGEKTGKLDKYEKSGFPIPHSFIRVFLLTL